MILLAGLAVLVITLQSSLAGVFRSSRPQLALKVAPFDAGARVKLASQLVGQDGAEANARALALDAIRRDPIQPGAFRVLAQGFDDGGVPPRAESLMLEAQRLSRRDLGVQMWLIDSYGKRRDYPRMLEHADIALRASESSRTGVFPLIAMAAFDRGMASQILKLLGERPDWAMPFARYVIGNAGDDAFVTDVARLMLDPKIEADRALYGALMQRLVDAGRPSLAFEVYRQPGIAGDDDPGSPVRNGGFEKAAGGSPFNWWLSQAPELWASQESAPEGDGAVLRVAATNGRSGEVVRQLLHLGSGSHRLRVRMGDVPADPYKRPEVRITCAERGESRGLLALKPDKSGANIPELSATFVVPENCGFQQLSVSIAGDGPQEAMTPWLDDLRID